MYTAICSTVVEVPNKSCCKRSQLAKFLRLVHSHQVPGDSGSDGARVNFGSFGVMMMMMTIIMIIIIVIIIGSVLNVGIVIFLIICFEFVQL